MTDGVSDEQFEQAIETARAEGNLARANVIRKLRSNRSDPGEWIPAPGDNHKEAPAQRRKLIGAWATEGYSSRQIAERLGIRDDVVRKIARECGITIPAGGGGASVAFW